MVRPKLAAPGKELEMEILGTWHPVTIPESFYGPENLRLKT